jgi:leader peptidase (prepilin peptidase)/N-methyltransferase
MDSVMVLYALIFFFGTLFGSFLNVVIYRLPRDESVAFPASHCQNCKTPLKLYHNIPIFAWLFLRGKCGFCGVNISVQYPIIEAISGLLFIVVFYKIGITVQALFISFLFLTLLALSIIDFRYKAVPTSLLVIAVIFTLIAQNDIFSFQRLLLFAGGAAILELFVTYYIQGIKSRILKDESLKEQVALGSGDIPIFGIIGALFSVELGLVVLFLSAIYAIIPSLINMLTKKDIETPFIPFLALGILSGFIFDAQLIELLHFILKI